ncbi:MAG: aspartate kinase [Bacillota bacterium]|nr:aspartate kinase [Bacillota bacterium]
MKIVVQKFGGTSVSTHDRRLLVVQKVKEAISSGFRPVVVVSAMGREGAPYATDTLLSLLDNEFKDNNKQAVDLLMSCGETISTAVMSNELSTNEISSIPLAGGQAGIITDDNFGDANVVKVETERLLKYIKENKVPVVAGFQGRSESGFVTTLGRGGSDVTASLLGVALFADKVEIYTDVDGLLTADPRIVSDAALIKEISYNEVFQFADQGAKVIHPRAVEIAMKGNIPLVIKNTLSNCEGTIINKYGEENTETIITGITHMKDRVQIIIKMDENEGNEKYFDIFNFLGNEMISVDLINVFPREKIFTIDKKDIKKLTTLMNTKKLKFNHVDDCSKIAVIGSRMRGIPGVMARILKALTKENVEILQTADSHMTIWCLVKTKYAETSIRALHKEFI